MIYIMYVVSKCVANIIMTSALFFANIDIGRMQKKNKYIKIFFFKFKMLQINKKKYF